VKSLAKASRVNTALQVIHHMNEGMTVVEACRAVGMPRSSYYYIVENNPQAIAEVQAIIDANNREQLGLILVSKTEMLRKIIEDGLSDMTKPKDRLAIYVKLDELLDRMTDTLHVESQLSKDAHEFLKRGPVLEPAKSRLTATERTITIETEG
jgi:hypothetical protein